MKNFRKYTKICPLCGREFTCNNKGRLYCGNSCKQQSYYQREELLLAAAKNDYKKYIEENDYTKYFSKNNGLVGALTNVAITGVYESLQPKIKDFSEFYSDYKKDFQNKMKKWKQEEKQLHQQHK